MRPRMAKAPGWPLRPSTNSDREAPPRPGPASSLELVLERERVQELHALIGLLRPEQQHLLALRYGADLGYEEIGAIVGTAPATARVRMHRILEEL